MRRFSASAIWLVLFYCAWLAPFLCVASMFAGAYFVIPADSILRIQRQPLLVYLGILLVTTLPSIIVGMRLLHRRRRGDAAIELLAAGLEHGDYRLIQQIFPHSEDVRLTSITGGYSGAAVFQARSWGLRASLQRSSIVKVGAMAKLQPEVENYERYVREYIGNTATLLYTAQRGNRMALRWAYAAFTGEHVETLAEHAARGAPLAPIINDLFASQSTLQLLLSTPRRDPQRLLYQEYSWTPRDWQRIVRAAAEIPKAAASPDPLATVQRWYDPETGTGERAMRSFDVPVATIHGDLNSRNILIDQRGAIFVIDFANTGPGHLLRDFARLETELILVVDQPGDSTTAQTRVQQFEQWLYTASGTPCVTLRDLLQSRTPDDQIGQAIAAIRRQAHDLAGPWLNGPAAPYLIALLHTTLDTLRYAQCGPETKQAALLIAGRLCVALE